MVQKQQESFIAHSDSDVISKNAWHAILYIALILAENIIMVYDHDGNLGKLID